MSVITFSKQYASGGPAVAEAVAKAMGYRLVGKSVLSELAKELDISEAQAEMMKRGQDTAWITWADKYLVHTVRRIAQKPESALNDHEYFAAVQRLVNKLAAEGDVVIMGWGSQLILGKQPGVTHIRVVAPLEDRGRSLAETRNYSLEQAMNECERQDGYSAAYVQHYLKGDWADPLNYHLVLNMGALDHDLKRALNIVKAAL